MLGLFKKKSKLADQITERTCVTVARPSGRMIVLDLVNDTGEPNPWSILVDFHNADGSLIDSGPSAMCYEAPLNVCNGDALLEFWLNEVEAD